MKRYIPIVISILVAFYIIFPFRVESQGNEVSINSSADATIVSNSSGLFGNAASLECSNSEDTFSSFVVKFDLSVIPADAVIDSAQLSLNQTNAEGEQVVLSVYRVSSSWNESSVSGVTKPTIDTSVSYGGVGLNSSNGIKLFSADFSDLVERWLTYPDGNYGLYFESNPTATYLYEFGSKESSTKPSLTIAYSLGDEDAPMISDIAVSDVTESSIRITWETNEEATTYIEYGENDQYGMLVGDDELVLVHTIDLTNLKSSTTYHFRVKNADEAGNEALSLDRTFDTLALAQEEDTDETETVTQPKDDTLIEESISPPANLTLKSSKENGINIVILEWEKSESEGIEAYRVYRSEEDRISYIFIGEVEADGTSYSDESVEEGKTYFYVIRAVVGEKESRDSNEEVVTVYGSEIVAELHGMDFWKGFLIFNVVFLPIFGVWYLVFRKKSGRKSKSGKKEKKKLNK